MRIRGRRLYPDNLSERRLMMQMGGTPLHVPRGISPYMIARRLARAASSNAPDLEFVRTVLARPAQRKAQLRSGAPASESHNAPTSVAA
jgi:hypothetical protein